MSKYYITDFNVKKLWGYKNYPLKFSKDVNVIIGPNASGKTTLINILYDTLSANFSRLSRTEFSEVTIGLKTFDGNETKTVSVTQTPEDLKIAVGNLNFKVPLLPFQHFSNVNDPDDVPPEIMMQRKFRMDLRGIREQLCGLVPAVWLPVSRRLPIANEEEMARRSLHRRPLESVDECLSGLIDELQKYRLSLNSELSELRKEFQRHALENILFDKEHDRSLRNRASLIPPSDGDKQQLLKAFRDVGLVDARMEIRINEHFSAAKEAVAKLNADPSKIDFGAFMIMPLIARTRSIVTFAQELETKRGKLFASLHEFESIVNSFLNEKEVSVSDRGEIVITPNREQRGPIEWRHLSSGEKQILILLTQALLSGRSPIVYVADEPELSLHVTWQEKLLGSLTKLAGRCQFIVATHSPDIAAGFGSKIIDLARF
ncbi:MAG: ATP-binding protein [Verrucomicrobia bacterium]|nr:ATP-binding protein [Verrucomicrobiota bacterium]